MQLTALDTQKVLCPSQANFVLPHWASRPSPVATHPSGHKKGFLGPGVSQHSTTKHGQVCYCSHCDAHLASAADHDVQTSEPWCTHRWSSSVLRLLSTRQTVPHDRSVVVIQYSCLARYTACYAHRAHHCLTTDCQVNAGNVLKIFFNIVGLR